MGKDMHLAGPGRCPQDVAAVIDKMARIFRAGKMGLPTDHPDVLKSYRSYYGPMRSAVSSLSSDEIELLKGRCHQEGTGRP